MLAWCRSRLTFANVVSLMALFVALSGGAYALTIPRNSVGTEQLKRSAVARSKIKPGAVTSPKVRDGSLLVKDFEAGQLPQGPPGTPGQTGPPGAPGQTGSPGSPAASSYSSRQFHDFTSAGQQGFAPISGIGPPSTTEEHQVVMRSPATTIVARDLFGFYREGGTSGGATRTFTLRVNGADTALSCR